MKQNNLQVKIDQKIERPNILFDVDVKHKSFKIFKKLIFAKKR